MSRGAPVEVEPWAILYAIRYGLARRTYAHADALTLITVHAGLLAHEHWLDDVAADLRWQCELQACNTADIDHHRAWRAIDAVNLGQETR